MDNRSTVRRPPARSSYRRTFAIPRLPILESTPLRNPYWQYSRDKIACEDLLLHAYREEGFPVTVVRPSHTYDRTKIALLGGWTDIHRMRAGLPVVVHGDGASLWTVTHSRDFAKAFVVLLGRYQAVGESYTITSDEFLTWDAIYRQFAQAAGVAGGSMRASCRAVTTGRFSSGRGPLGILQRRLIRFAVRAGRRSGVVLVRNCRFFLGRVLAGVEGEALGRSVPGLVLVLVLVSRVPLGVGGRFAHGRDP
ncbi:UNVERIFIED_ORG: hypothetical protein J2X79_000844 [Arthrobacter globiformis]|nr:hypothetical protein [Arthrobacter globiformis]